MNFTAVIIFDTYFFPERGEVCSSMYSNAFIWVNQFGTPEQSTSKVTKKGPEVLGPVEGIE